MGRFHLPITTHRCVRVWMGLAFSIRLGTHGDVSKAFSLYVSSLRHGHWLGLLLSYTPMDWIGLGGTLPRQTLCNTIKSFLSTLIINFAICAFASCCCDARAKYASEALRVGALGLHAVLAQSL